VARTFAILCSVTLTTLQATKLMQSSSNAVSSVVPYFQAAVERYPDLPVDEALVSSNLVHRALAVLDRRLGKRRLGKLECRTDEHPLVMGLYRFRCSSEGVPVPGETGRGRTRG
jgi:hypothetical protein